MIIIKNVIILGAGASASEGAPVQSNLFREYFLHKKVKGGILDPHLKDYFNYFWSINLDDRIDDVVFPTFEEALGMLELARNRQECFHKLYNTSNINKIDHTIEDLVFLIAEILKIKLDIINNHHIMLVNKLITTRRIRNTSFISFNYDILMDNALTMRGDKIDLDYCVDNIKTEDGKNIDPPITSKAVKLLKIHGSLNWLYCPVCKKITLTPTEKSVTRLIRKDEKHSKKCYCGGAYVPILIPPTFFKVMSNPHLVHIWEQAEDIVRDCENIVFCGYSLPDADIHIKYLLKRGILNRKTRQPFLTVVNNHSKKSKTEITEERKRYERLFGKNVNYSPTSFETFCRMPGKYLI